jgi:conjugative relaxase-like TrwC/TraI family protein
MMGLAKMSPDGWRYYASEIVAGAEDHFVGHGEEPGRWIGRGCEAIGVSGAVDEEGLGRLFGEGCHPVTGAGLGRVFDPERAGSVAGFALSFSPPKSVSVLWALVDPEFSEAVRGAHEAAVAAKDATQYGWPPEFAERPRRIRHATHPRDTVVSISAW